MLRQKENQYSASEKAILDVLSDSSIDLSPGEIAEQCEFSHSTVRRTLDDLEEDDKVVVTRYMSNTKMYESKTMRQLKYNLKYSNSNGEGYIEDFILNTLEYAKQDIDIMSLVKVSGFSHQQVRETMNQLEEEGKVVQTRKVDQSRLFTTTE